MSLYIIIAGCYFSRIALTNAVVTQFQDDKIIAFTSIVDFVVWRKKNPDEITALFINISASNDCTSDGIKDVLSNNWRALSVKPSHIILFVDGASDLLCFLAERMGIKFLINTKNSISHIRQSILMLHHYHYNDSQQQLSALLLPSIKEKKEKIQSLTRKEYMALEMIMNSGSLAEQAARLGVSMKTLYGQRNAAIVKLGFSHYRDIINNQDLVKIFLLESYMAGRQWVMR